MSKTLNTLLDVSKPDAEVNSLKPKTLENQPTLSAIKLSTKHKNSTNDLFGFNQSKVIIFGINNDDHIELNSRLQDWQCDVQCFNSAEEAIHILAQQTWEPRLIISDFCLTGNKLDFDEIRFIQDFYAFDIQAIILIDDTDPVKIQLAKDNGFTILYKPINAAQLRFAMKKKLSLHTHQVASA